MMLKKILTAGVLTCALGLGILEMSSSVEAATMADYAGLKSVSSLSRMDVVDLAEARRTAPELKEVGDWYRRVGYYWGDKDYAITTGWAPQKVQLVTPYSLTKYLEYEANQNLMKPEQGLLDEVMQYKDIAWVWVWSNGSYNILSADSPAPTVVNVVIHTPDNEFYYPLEKAQYIPAKVMSKANLKETQLWPFPAKIFSQRNVPFEVIVVDDKGNKKPLPIGKENLAKCK